MKKLLSILGFIFCFAAAFGQPITPRGSATNTVADQRLQATLNLYCPRYADTTAALASTNEGIDSCGAVIFTYDVMSLWVRKCSPKRWELIGGTVVTANSTSITFTGSGTIASPLSAAIAISGAGGNAIQLNGDGIYSPIMLTDGLKTGGNISNVGGIYTYDVQVSTYVIGGVEYGAPTTQVTLSNSDPTFDRIDRIVLTTSNTVVVIEGTPADDPQEPSYDPLTQLPLGIVYVTANSSGPTVTNENIYINNTEWTTSSSTVRINPASAVNPFSSPLDVEGTAVQSTDFITFTDPSPPTNLTNYKILTMKIFSKGTWAAGSRITFQWRNGTTLLGLPVSIFDGALFNSSQTSSYQTFTASLTNFGQVTNVTNLLMTITNVSPNTIGFYIDDIVLQGGDGAIVPAIGTFHQQGGNRYGSEFVVGSQDNFNTTVIANNLPIATFTPAGTTWLRQTNPGISFFLGTLATSDYFIQRNGTTLTLNIASAAIISNTIAGVSVYNLSAANGALWNSTAAAFQMQLNSSGQLLVGTNSATASNLAAFNSTTRAVRLTNQTTGQMNAIANDAGMITYNTTVGSLYYNNGSGWFPIGGAVTASNGLNMSTASNVELGGTLNKITSIASNTFYIAITGTVAGNPSFNVTNSGGTAISGDGTVYGVSGNTTGGSAVRGAATTGYAIDGRNTSTTTPTGRLLSASSNTNSVIPILLLDRESTGSAANGIGGSIQFKNYTTDGFTYLSTELKSKLTDVNTASRTSQFQIDGVSAAATATIATFDGTGVVGIGVTSSFLGTRLDVRDNSATGTMVNLSSSSSSWTSSGAGLVEINFSGVNSGASLNTQALGITNTRTGAGVVTNVGVDVDVSGGTINYGIRSISSGYGVYGEGTLGVVGAGTSGGGAGGEFFNDFGGEGVRTSSEDGLPLQVYVNSTGNTATTQLVTVFGRNQTSGTPANGFGIQFQYSLATATSNDDAMVENIVWTNATHATRTSQYTIRLNDNAVEADVFEIAGNGALQLGAAYQSLGVGYLSVDNSGNVTWSAGSGGGGGDVVKVGTPVDNQIGIWTGNGTIEGDVDFTATGSTMTIGLAGTSTGILQLTGVTSGTISIQGASAAGTYTLTLPTDDGTASQVLTTNGSGVLSWTTPAGGGTVTSVGVSSTDITVGGSPITGAGTITLTLATVNGNVGTFGSSTSIPTFTVNAKGLITAASSNVVIAPAGTLTGTTLAANVVSSSLTSHGTITSGGLGTGAVIGDVTINVAGTDATGDMYYRSAAGIFTRLPNGTAGQLLSSNGTIPVWIAAGTGGTVTSVNATSTSLTITGGPITTSGTFVINLNGNALGLQSVNTTGFVIRSGANTFVTQAQIALASQVSGVLPVANGGTNISSLTTNRILVSSGATTFTQDLPTGANGISVSIAAGHMTITNTFNPSVQTLTDAATIVWNVTNGGNAFVNLVGTGRTLSITNPVAGYTYTIRVAQGSANRTITTWPTGTRWIGGTPPTLSTTAGAMDVISLYYDGANFYGAFGLSYSFIDIPSLNRKIVPMINDTEIFEIAA